MPTDKQPIDDLLLYWQQCHDMGKQISVEQLCKKHPHLIDEIREKIEALRQMSWLDEDFDLAENDTAANANLAAEESSLDDFIQRLLANKLLKSEEIQERLQSFPGSNPNVAEFAQHLVNAGIITFFQSQALIWNFPKRLRIGGYLILDRIGSGGMGFVFKAYHHPLRRYVALKLLRDDLPGSHGSQWRFRRESRIVGKLNHSNIVTAFDAGEEDGMDFLVMEYIKGRNLAEYVEQHGPFEWSRAVGLILQAAEGLAYAHRANLIHRDIKPSNLLLTYDEKKKETVKILDLGMARPNQNFDEEDDSVLQKCSSSAETVADINVTQTGAICGTAAYMAPEQHISVRNADHRTDIYSLGCTLHFLITGESVNGEINDCGLSTEFSHPSKPSLRNKVPDVPVNLERVFQKMVAYERSQRFDSMDAVIEALKPFAPQPKWYTELSWRQLAVWTAFAAVSAIAVWAVWWK